MNKINLHLLIQGNVKLQADWLPIASKIESDKESALLAASLLSLAENKDGIESTVGLRAAREVFLIDALLRCGLSELEKQKYINWLSEFEKKFITLLRSQTRRSYVPLIEDDRLKYFLHLATQKYPNSKLGHNRAVQILTPFLFTKLLLHIEKERNYGKTSISDDLPNQLSIFIRFFPQDRILNEYTLVNSITINDIKRSLDAYWQTDTGAAEIETIDRYGKQIARLLRIEGSDVLRAPKIDSKQFQKAFGFSASNRILIESLDEEFTQSELVVREDNNDDIEHSLENSYKVSFGDWKGQIENSRAVYHVDTHDVRGLLPGEIVWLTELLDTMVENPHVRRLPLLLWCALVTGIPVKRLLNLRFADSANFNLSQLEDEDTIEESPLYLFADEGLIVAKRTAALNPFSRSCSVIPSPAYREQSDWIPLNLGQRGIRYAIAARLSRTSNTSQIVFANSKNPTEPLTVDNLSKILEVLNGEKDILPHLSLTWSRIKATARAYCNEAEVTEIVYALSSGRPKHEEMTRLHYIAYNSEDFFIDHGKVIQAFESLVDGVRGVCIKDDIKSRISQIKKNSDLTAILEKNLGGAYIPRPGLVSRGWKAICKAENENSHPETFQQNFNFKTLRALFSLMMNTGIREQELDEIERSKLDLETGVIRIKGKSGKYFKESREIPLSSIAIEEIKKYLKARESLKELQTEFLFVVIDDHDKPQPLPPGTIDWLVSEANLSREIIFSLRTLRHALRTALHESQADYTAVNEFFGHVIEQTTITHKLSGTRYNLIQNSFREAVSEAVAKLLL